MSRLPILAEQFPDSAVAASLREHREDRDALLARLTVSLHADSRVRAAWLWGSLGRGDADDLSDLDPWVVLTEEAVTEMGLVLRHYAEQAGGLIHAGEAPHNAPPHGGYLGALHAGRHGLLHVDWYWQAQSAVTALPKDAVFLNRLTPPVPSSDWQPVTGGQPFQPVTGWRGRVEGGISFMWLMLSIAAKGLARDPQSDLGLMLYPRSGFEEAITLIGQERDVLPLDWSVPETPQEKVERLRDLARMAERMTVAANAQGLNLPLAYAPCLHRYLDMVAGIIDYGRWRE